MGRRKKSGQPSTLSRQVREILVRTKKSRMELDAKLADFKSDDRTPVMVKASRQKRSNNTKARRARERATDGVTDGAIDAAIDAAVDAFMVNGAAVACEVVESLRPVMAPPASLRGVRIG